MWISSNLKASINCFRYKKIALILDWLSILYLVCDKNQINALNKLKGLSESTGKNIAISCLYQLFSNPDTMRNIIIHEPRVRSWLIVIPSCPSIECEVLWWSRTWQRAIASLARSAITLSFQRSPLKLQSMRTLSEIILNRKQPKFSSDY